MRLSTNWRDQADPRVNIPAEIRDAVTTWFRQWGRNATLEFNLHMRCPMIRVERFANDPMRAHEETQIILMQERGWVEKPGGRRVPVMLPVELNQMGASGVVNWLDEHNLFGGRKTLDDVIDENAAVNAAGREAKLKEIEDGAREEAWLRRRKILGNPFTGVGIDLNQKAKDEN